MTEREGRPSGAAGAAAIEDTTEAIVAPVADAELIRRADRALRAALREGLHGPEVEHLLDWVAQQRVLLRRQAARAAVADALSAIRSKGAA